MEEEHEETNTSDASIPESDEETPYDYEPAPDALIIPDLYLPPGLVNNKPIDWELHNRGPQFPNTECPICYDDLYEIPEGDFTQGMTVMTPCCRNNCHFHCLY